MSKTAPIPDEIHALIIDKQTEMRKKHKINVKISDLIAACVTDSIKRAERFFGINSTHNDIQTGANNKESRSNDISGGNRSSLVEPNNGELKSSGGNILKPSEILIEKEEVNT